MPSEPVAALILIIFEITFELACSFSYSNELNCQYPLNKERLNIFEYNFRFNYYNYIQLNIIKHQIIILFSFSFNYVLVFIF